MINILKKAALPAAVAMACVTSANAFVVNKTFTNNYYEGPDQSGRGIILDVFPDANQEFGNNVLVQWFTYREGEPIWLIADGSIDQNTNVATLNVRELVGGDFGPEFRTADATSADWGTATLTFNSCNEIVLEYNGTDGEGTQTLQPILPSNCVVQEKFTECPSFSTPGAIRGSCIIQGDIDTDVTLSNEITWLPQGQVNILDGATVTIEPNTEIVGGSSGGVDFVVVRQGAKMIADGTKDNPIIMRGVNALARGEWGGLTVNGYAPINGCPEGTEVCTNEGEGDSGTYGGNDPHDNSGIFRYLVVSNAGFEFSPDNELNGIAFQGVGDGTVAEYIQVHMNADDGIEPFGGTVNMKHIVLTGNGDDSFDWVRGYQGNVQHVVIKHYTDDGDQGIEADNLGSNQDSLPRSFPKLANFTIIGQTNTDVGVLVRAGTAANMANFVVTGMGETCLDIDDAATFTQGTEGNLTIVNSVMGGCAETFSDSEDGDAFLVSTWFLDQTGNVNADPQLSNYMPGAASPALGIGAVPFDDAFFDNVDYAGAFRDAKSDWTKGWTVGLDRNAPISQ